jgi:hypothetical protein
MMGWMIGIVVTIEKSCRGRRRRPDGHYRRVTNRTWRVFFGMYRCKRLAYRSCSVSLAPLLYLQPGQENDNPPAYSIIAQIPVDPSEVKGARRPCDLSFEVAEQRVTNAPCIDRYRAVGYILLLRYRCEFAVKPGRTVT